jgi:S1-C subfamily serine protease
MARAGWRYTFVWRPVCHRSRFRPFRSCSGDRFVPPHLTRWCGESPCPPRPRRRTWLAGDLHQLGPRLRVRAGATAPADQWTSLHRIVDDLPEIIDVVRPSVVQISCTISGNSPEVRAQLGGKLVKHLPLGTGFLVSDAAHVITAQHVLAVARGMPGHYPGADIRVGVGLAHPNTENMRANFSVTGFSVIEEDARHDLALLQMQQNPFQGEMSSGIVIGDSAVELLHQVATIDMTRPRDGERVAISGYPLGETVLVTNAGIIASSWSMTADEIPNPAWPDVSIPEMRDTFLADVQTNPGNSGGPVYSVSDGSVIGVLVALRLTNVIAGGSPAMVNGIPLTVDAGVSVVVPAKYVCEMLDRNSVAWKPR